MKNEPAFPIITWGSPSGLELVKLQEGMTKRELIAMHAMAAILMSPYLPESGFAPSNTAFRAVEMADALLAALGEQS